MSIQFDWQEGDGEQQSNESQKRSPRSWMPNGLFWMVAAIILVAGILAIWFASRRRAVQAEETLQNRLQRLVDLESQAVKQGDGELFATLQTDDPAWFSYQLRPQSQIFNRADRTVTRVGQIGDQIWSNVVWEDGSKKYQRLMFFVWENGFLHRASTSSNYWSGLESVSRFSQPWGTLILPEEDAPWEQAISEFVTDFLLENCESACRRQIPFTLRIVNRYPDNLPSAELLVPTPRLIALDGDGQPADLFWEELRATLINRFSPQRIRFGVPVNSPSEDFSSSYRQLSIQFMQQNPEVFVEIVALDGNDRDEAAWLAELDGAAIRPTEDLIASGLIRDLTPYANQVEDFHPQIWAGGIWQDRVWMMPASAGMNLLYYDRDYFQQNQIAGLAIGDDWSTFAQILEALSVSKQSSDFPPVFLDASRDALYSYAFSWGHGCTETPCLPALTNAKVSAAYEWYLDMAFSRQLLVDLSQTPASERIQVSLGLTSAHREVFIWSGSPFSYEYYRGLWNLGLVPFPNFSSVSNAALSEFTPGITPLHIEGYVVSQQSERPDLTWQWLNFLSHQSPIPANRKIPARISVSNQTAYWQRLPNELGLVMAEAFPYARPIRIGEEELFSWETLGIVADGDLTPQNAGNMARDMRWFGID